MKKTYTFKGANGYPDQVSTYDVPNSVLEISTATPYKEELPEFYVAIDQDDYHKSDSEGQRVIVYKKEDAQAIVDFLTKEFEL